MIHVRKFNVQCAPCDNDKIKFKYVILNVHTMPMQHMQATLYGKWYFHWRRWRRRQVLFVMVKCLQKQTTSENERKNGDTATVTYTHVKCSLRSTIYLWINYKLSGLPTVVHFEVRYAQFYTWLKTGFVFDATEARSVWCMSLYREIFTQMPFVFNTLNNVWPFKLDLFVDWTFEWN